MRQIASAIRSLFFIFFSFLNGCWNFGTRKKCSTQQSIKRRLRLLNYMYEISFFFLSTLNGWRIIWQADGVSRPKGSMNRWCFVTSVACLSVLALTVQQQQPVANLLRIVSNTKWHKHFSLLLSRSSFVSHASHSCAVDWTNSFSCCWKERADVHTTDPLCGRVIQSTTRWWPHFFVVVVVSSHQPIIFHIF